MPAIPKIHQIERAQRRGEVFRQTETEQHGDADYKVAVSCEVKKKLEGVAIDGGEDAEPVKLRGVFKHGRHPAFVQAARKPPFLRDARQYQAHRQRGAQDAARGGGLDLGLRALGDADHFILIRHGADDRARCDGGEKAQVQQQVCPCERLDQRGAVGFHQIGDGLEGVIRHADGHQDVHDFALPEVVLQIGAEEVVVFEHAEKQEAA